MIQERCGEGVDIDGYFGPQTWEKMKDDMIKFYNAGD